MVAYINRHIEVNIWDALEDTPVILLQGARQVGKSTLVKKICSDIGGKHVTLDDDNLRIAAENDPIGFVEQNGENTLVIDEIQLCPSLLRSIKYAVDKNRKPGRFILTGSADVLHVAGVNESLAGRKETIKLNPFSMGEILGVKEDFVAKLMNDPNNLTVNKPLNRKEYIDLICTGGYPDVINRTPKRRNRYFQDYLSSVFDHDAVEISGLAHLDKLNLIFTILSAQTSEELIQAKLANLVNIPESSIHAYIRLLSDLYLINMLPAWGKNLTKRAVSRKKVSLLDTGIAAHINKDTNESLEDFSNGNELGSLVESFVVNELLKQQGWSDIDYSLYHFRDNHGNEVDIIIELPNDNIIAIEIKAASTVSRNDLKGIKFIKEKLRDRFFGGVILYTGSEVLSLGDDIYCAPINAIWNK